ncbi:SWIM zinc finger family protein [Halolamina rubra]|uniref:SWIM zinc finger family protein n=1 Tax=Halolamina rubra TaxID=1380430 RepID=UPI00067884A7|nr:SWIM zinc finger family protein [Halolamina rubra]
MEDIPTTADKRIVEELSFGAKTAKRVGWEQFEFGVEAPHLVRVTNASYGCEKDDHSYLVGVEDRDGLLVPAECECPADKYNEEYDCKHKVALATIGGPVVLQAAVDYSTPTQDTEGIGSKTLAERVRADGGVIPKERREEAGGVIDDEREECDCSKLSGGFPCFDCYLAGEKELPD